MSDKVSNDEEGVPNDAAARDDGVEHSAPAGDVVEHDATHDGAVEHDATHDGAVEHDVAERPTPARGMSRHRPFGASLRARIRDSLLQPRQRWRRSRSVRLAAIGSAITIAAFAIGAFVVVPILVDRAVRQFASSSPERVAAVERVRVAPFSLTVDLLGGTVEDPMIGTTLTFDRVRLNFGFAALLQNTVVFDELSVERPELRVDVANGDASASIDSLRRLLVALTERPMRLRRFVVEGGLAQITGLASDETRTLELRDIAVTATDIEGNSGAPAQYVVSLRDAAGAALQLDGTLTTAPRATQGTLSAQGVDVAGLVDWLRASSGAPTAGTLAAAADFAWRADRGLELTAASGSISAPRFELVPGIIAEARLLEFRGAAEVPASDPSSPVTADGDFELVEAVMTNRQGELLAAERIAASGAMLQPLSAGESLVGLTIDTLRLERPRLDVALERRPPLAGTGRSDADIRSEVPVTLGLLGSVQHPLDELVTFATPSSDRPVAVRRADIIEGRVSILDRGVSPPARFDASAVHGMLASAGAAPPDATLSSTVTEGGDDFVVDLEGRIGERGVVTLKSRVGAADLERQTVELGMRDVEAGMLSPYFAAMAGRALVTGFVDLHLEYGVGGGDPQAERTLVAPLPARRTARATTSQSRPAESPGESASREPMGVQLPGLRGELRIAARDLSLGRAAAETAAEAPPAAAPAETAPAGTEPLQRRDVPVGESAATPGEAQVRWELGLALLQDRTGSVALTLPLAHDDARAPGTAIADALRDYVGALTAAPFEIVAEIVGGSAHALRSVAFGPGAATPHPSTNDKLTALAAALDERPRLGLRVAGRADRALDRDALAAQQIELHVTLATAGLTMIARPKPIDFTSPRAWDVLDEFASERLSAERLATIASYFTRDAGGRVADDEKESYYRALFDALVANEPIPDNALRRLARYRAQSVADALAALGVAVGRVDLGEELVTDAGEESAGQQSAQPGGQQSAQPSEQPAGQQSERPARQQSEQSGPRLIEVPLALQSDENPPAESVAERPDLATVSTTEAELEAARAARSE